MGRGHPATLVPGAGGGSQPGAGRPTNEFRALMQSLAGSDDRTAQLKAILDEGPSNPHYMAALKHVTEHGYGKAPQSMDITSGGQPMKAYMVFDPEKDV